MRSMISICCSFGARDCWNRRKEDGNDEAPTHQRADEALAAGAHGEDRGEGRHRDRGAGSARARTARRRKAISGGYGEGSESVAGTRSLTTGGVAPGQFFLPGRVSSWQCLRRVRRSTVPDWGQSESPSSPVEDGDSHPALQRPRVASSVQPDTPAPIGLRGPPAAAAAVEVLVFRGPPPPGPLGSTADRSTTAASAPGFARAVALSPAGRTRRGAGRRRSSPRYTAALQPRRSSACRWCRPAGRPRPVSRRSPCPRPPAPARRRSLRWA